MSDNSSREIQAIREQLESQATENRLAAVEKAHREDIGGVRTASYGDDVNNHVHTRYSFSPYSPSSVAFHARIAGLRVVGSVDHDSISAAGEMRSAAGILDMGATVGAEVRVSFADTEYAERRLNNPDTSGNAYMVLHAVPQGSWVALARRLQSITEAREKRNRRQVQRLNQIVGETMGSIDYDQDVRPLSWVERGGSVTERHIMYALSVRVTETEPNPKSALDLITEKLGLSVPPKVAELLLDSANPHRLYDMLGIFKSGLVPRIFQQPDDQECPPVREITGLAQSLGAIPAYAYLGDVGESPTGDKKAQTFEDSYLDELFPGLADLGFQAVTYMPPRNTVEQLRRVQKLAAANGLMEISGVDINSSRQTFHCEEIGQADFRHLIESTWALVGHELATRDDPAAGIFGAESPVAGKPLSDRLAHYARLGRGSVPAGRE